ncbi:MAG TPA: hypothetical protein VKX33_05735, partial [Cyclobacteriaceae bacterium]|nr:hypothetical protein [Cyclobacteriaceae bacterium]
IGFFKCDIGFLTSAHAWRKAARPFSTSTIDRSVRYRDCLLRHRTSLDPGSFITVASIKRFHYLSS